jgi:hypothetical protein
MALFGTLVNSDASGATGVRNMLINGDFRVWQKGTDLNTAITGNAVTTVDRWTTQYADFAARIRKVEDTLANNEIVDTAEITKISGTYNSCEFSQKVETTVAKYLRGRTVTFSFWIKKVGATFGSHQYDCWIGDSETVDDTVWTNTRTIDRGRATRQSGISAAVTFTDNIWRKITITRTLTSDTNTIYCTIYTQNTPTNEGIRIANCQLELGSVATPFEKRPLAMELQMCQRYYQKSYNQSTAPGSAATVGDLIFQAAATGGESCPIVVLPVPMRIAPTRVFHNPQTGAAGGYFNYTTSTNVGMTGTNTDGERGWSGGPGTSAGHICGYQYTANAEF